MSSCAVMPICRISVCSPRPNGRLLFDLNDFDETLPGPFEYDVKRMAASFTIAARNNGFSKADTRAATLASVTAYREAMADVRADADAGHLVCPPERGRADGRGPRRGGRGSEGRPRRREGEEGEGRGQGGGEGRAARRRRPPRRRTRGTACRRCPSSVSWPMGRYRIVSQPPVVVPARDLAATYGLSPDEVDQVIRDQFRAYRATLQDDRRRLLERFEIVDMARKVVGVGSVGTRAFIVLLQGRDARDPLFLQVKEATASVLEDYLPKSRYRQHGRAGRAGAADDAGRQRHLPRLDQGAGREPRLLLAPAARHEGLGAGRVDDTAGADVLRPHLRVDAGAGACPVRRPGRHHRIPRRRRRVRRVDHRLLASATPTRTRRTTRNS